MCGAHSSGEFGNTTRSDLIRMVARGVAWHKCMWKHTSKRVSVLKQPAIICDLVHREKYNPSNQHSSPVKLSLCQMSTKDFSVLGCCSLLRLFVQLQLAKQTCKQENTMYNDK